MSEEHFRIFPLGDTALTVEFGNSISVELNTKALALSEYFEQTPFPGFIESVPAYASTTIFYNLVETRKAFPEYLTAFESVERLVEQAIGEEQISQRQPRPTIEIPVHFDLDSALDLKSLAEAKGLTCDKIIEIFTAVEYRVYMLGFLPGFTYMGEADEQIAMPRKQTPRTHVPKGSVGIAGRQTGIYSLASPGGWQIIGRTDVEMFTPDAETPSYLRPGDEVRFVNADL